MPTEGFNTSRLRQIPSMSPHSRLFSALYQSCVNAVQCCLNVHWRKLRSQYDCPPLIPDWGKCRGGMLSLLIHIRQHMCGGTRTSCLAWDSTFYSGPPAWARGGLCGNPMKFRGQQCWSRWWGVWLKGGRRRSSWQVSVDHRSSN